MRRFGTAGVQYLSRMVEDFSKGTPGMLQRREFTQTLYAMFRTAIRTERSRKYGQLPAVGGGLFNPLAQESRKRLLSSSCTTANTSG